MELLSTLSPYFRPSIIFSVLLILILFLLIFFYEKIYIFCLKRAKKHKKILIIDDKNFPYFSELRQSGYQVEKINDIDSSMVEKIIEGEYAVILLDIKGVGKKLKCQNEGLGILEYLKEKRSRQCILIFSDEQWGLEHQEYFNLADTTLPKTSGLLEFKNKIDNLLLKSYINHFSALTKIIKWGGAIWKKIS